MPAIWVLLFSPVAGWMADRMGRRKLLVSAMIVYAFVGTAPAFLDNLYAIVVSRIAVGICESIVMTVSTTLISDYFKGHARERWLASQTAVASVTALGCIYLGGQLGAAYGWRGPFYLYMYSLPLAVCVLATIWEPSPAEPVVATAVVTEDVRYTTVPWARIAGILAITLLASISFYTVVTKNAEALVSLGVSNPADIGTLTMLASIGVPLGTFIFWGVMTNTFDVVAMGAGHNGLVAAAYLAKAGKKVLVLERKPWPGGGVVTREINTPGYWHDEHSSVHIMIQGNPMIRQDELGLQSRSGSSTGTTFPTP
jgi:MFS family permease